MKGFLFSCIAGLLALGIYTPQVEAVQGTSTVVHNNVINVLENGLGVVSIPQSELVPTRVELRASYGISWVDEVRAGATPAAVIASWDYPERGGLPSAGDYGTFGDTFVDLDVRAFGMRAVSQVRRIIQTVVVAPGETAFLTYDGGTFIGANSTTDAKVISNFVGTGQVNLPYTFTSEDHLAGGSNARINRSTISNASITVIYYYD